MLYTKAEAKVDNTLRYLKNSSYPKIAKFNNNLLLYYLFKLFSNSWSRKWALCFFCSPKITQPRPRIFSVNGSIICSRLHFWRHQFNMAKFFPNLERICPRINVTYYRCMMEWLGLLLSNIQQLSNILIGWIFYGMVQHKYI